MNPESTLATGTAPLADEKPRVIARDVLRFIGRWLARGFIVLAGLIIGAFVGQFISLCLNWIPFSC